LHVDLVSAGLSCHPFSKLRFTAGTTQNTGRPEDHSEFDFIFKHFFEYLDSRKPITLIVEEVKEFMYTKGDTAFGKYFMDMSAQRFYSQRSWPINSDVWITWPRGRVVISGTRLGGEVAEAIKSHAEETIASAAQSSSLSSM
jgi:site-specific DNA-cytosine methylase